MNGVKIGSRCVFYIGGHEICGIVVAELPGCGCGYWIIRSIRSGGDFQRAKSGVFPA